MKRVFAIVGVVVMISVALLIRSARDSDDSSASSGNSDTITIACVPELEEQCKTLAGAGVEIRVEDAEDTAKALRDGDADIDGWFTLSPWPAITNAAAEREVVQNDTPVASAGLAIAMAKDRSAVLARSCPGGRVAWKCLVDASGKPWSELGGDPLWGSVQIGLPPRSSAEGLLLNGNAVAGYFGNADVATNNFDADQGFREWQSKLNKASDDPQAFTKFVQQFPAAYSAVGASTAEASHLGTRDEVVDVIPGSPAGNVGAVLVPVAGSSNADKVNDLAKRKALQDAFSVGGWSVPAQQDAGLPNPGVLLALSGLGG